MRFRNQSTHAWHMCVFLKQLFKMQSDREREKGERNRVMEKYLLSVDSLSKTLQKPDQQRAECKSLKLCSGFLSEWSPTLAIFSCLPQSVKRKLAYKRSSQDSNQFSDIGCDQQKHLVQPAKPQCLPSICFLKSFM